MGEPDDADARVDEPGDVAPDPLAPGVVKSVGEHPRRRGRYRVRLTDGRELLVDAATFAAAGPIREGTELTRAAIARLHDGAADVEAFDRALSLLARARRTSRELALRLRQRGIDRDRIDRVIARLREQGLVDDDAVADAEAASRLRRGEAPGRVRQRLRQKGVQGDVAERAVREAVQETGTDERALCLAAAEKRVARMGALEPRVRRRRLAGFLQRRGFGAGVIADVLRQIDRP